MYFLWILQLLKLFVPWIVLFSPPLILFNPTTLQLSSSGFAKEFCHSFARIWGSFPAAVLIHTQLFACLEIYILYSSSHRSNKSLHFDFSQAWGKLHSLLIWLRARLFLHFTYTYFPLPNNSESLSNAFSLQHRIIPEVLQEFWSWSRTGQLSKGRQQPYKGWMLIYKISGTCTGSGTAALHSYLLSPAQGSFSQQAKHQSHQQKHLSVIISAYLPNKMFNASEYKQRTAWSPVKCWRIHLNTLKHCHKKKDNTQYICC